MDADERRLVEAAQRDPARFADLYDRHVERVYAFVLRRVADRDAAEDVTADVFHRALAGLRGFQFRGAPFAAWLLRIAANAVIDRAKRAGREVTAPDGVPEASVDSEAEALDRRTDLFRLVESLPPDQHRVIVERFIDQRSIREIAARMQKSEGAIKQLQFRALQTLRERIEDPDV